MVPVQGKIKRRPGASLASLSPRFSFLLPLALKARMDSQARTAHKPSFSLRHQAVSAILTQAILRAVSGCSV